MDPKGFVFWFNDGRAFPVIFPSISVEVLVAFWTGEVIGVFGAVPLAFCYVGEPK